MAKRRVMYSTRCHVLEPVRPEAVLPDRALCLPAFSHFFIVNKTSLSPPPLSIKLLSLSLSHSLSEANPVSLIQHTVPSRGEIANAGTSSRPRHMHANMYLHPGVPHPVRGSWDAGGKEGVLEEDSDLQEYPSTQAPKYQRLTLSLGRGPVITNSLRSRKARRATPVYVCVCE
jgi:hypothetical protein